LLIFCGYVEIYATPALLLLFYIYSCIRYLQKKSALWFPLLALAMAIASHLIAAAAIPSLLVAVYCRYPHKFMLISNMDKKAFYFLIVVLVFLAMALVFVSRSGFAMPLSKKQSNGYITFLSLPHLWEYINGQILCSGLSLFILLWYLIKAARE